MKSRVGLLVAALALGLVAVPTATAAYGSGRPQAAELASDTDGNPVLNRDFPDPDVIKAANGWYYAYSTQTEAPEGHVNIQVAKSRDLVHWHYLGDALPKLPD